MTTQERTHRGSRASPVEALAAPEERRRVLSQLTLRMAWGVAAAWVLLALPQFWVGRPWVITTHFCAAAGSAAAALLASRRPVGGLYVMGIVSTLGVALIGGMTGGHGSPAVYFLALLPLLAGLLDLKVYRLSWLVISLSGILAVGVLSAWLPQEVPEQPFEQLVAPMGMGVLLFVFGTLWRRAANTQLELLERRNGEIARQADVLEAQSVELAQARETAEQASAAKSRFVAMTAHELRGPLNGLLGMAHVLADTRLSSHQVDLVSALSTSAESLGKVLQDLLDLSKIEAGRIDVTRQPFEPRELAADVIDGFAGLADRKKVELASLVDGAVPSVVVDDAGRLRQILSNLVANAVKFTSEGEVRLEVGLRGDRIIYTVRDTGRGIEPEHVERIFAPFEQVSDALLDRRAGTGLGLWISRSFVEAMGGKLRVESTPKEGSVFHVELPLLSATAKDGDDHEAEGRGGHVLVHTTTPLSRQSLLSLEHGLSVEFEPFEDVANLGALIRRDTQLVVLDGDQLSPERIKVTAEALPASVDVALASSIHALTRIEAQASGLGRKASVLLKPHRASRILSLLRREPMDATPPPLSPDEVQGTLLVVDDDAINRKVVRFSASWLGYRVLEAGSGESALEILGTRPVDVVLLDLHMDGMDGAETAAQIVARTTEANRPSLIGYTGSVNEEDRARCLASGMAEVLMKPLERAALAAALTRAKRLRGRRRSSSSGSVEAMVPVLDESVYEKLVVGMGHAEDVREMARDLLAELGPRVKKIREGLLGADRVTMRREAHKLASAVATFGGTRLALACRRLEVTAETESFSLLEARVAEIESRNADFAPALERMMQAT